MTLSPGYIVTQQLIGIVLLLQGKPESALAAIQKETFEPWRLLSLVLAYHALAFRGEADEAFEWLDKAAAQNDPGLTGIGTWPLFANIESDPRWLPFLESVGKSPRQLAAIEFKVPEPE